jgi:hypothetical protein
VVLPGDIGEKLGTVFAGEYEVCHGIESGQARGRVSKDCIAYHPSTFCAAAEIHSIIAGGERNIPFESGVLTSVRGGICDAEISL